MSEPSDPVLVARAADGDVQAFEGLVRRYQLAILRLCLGMLGNRNDAEEAVQDTFLDAWRALSRFRHDAKFSTWLYRLAVNRCLKQLAKKPSPCFALTDRAGSWGQPEAEFEATQRLRAATVAIGRLTPEQRAPLLLREVDGLTYTEIAQTLGVTMTAVKSRLSRARIEMAREVDATR